MRNTGAVEQESPPGRSAANVDPKDDRRVHQALRRIIRGVEIDSRRIAAEYEVTGPQLVCLRVIVDRGPVTATAIARAVHLSTSTVVGILDRLEEKGLIQRERDADDRRLVNVTVTGKGQRLISSGPWTVNDRLAAALDRLPEGERVRIAESLEWIAELIEAR